MASAVKIKYVKGDLFDAWAGREDELRELMAASYARDVQAMRREGAFLPWEDAERILTCDRIKLMTAIMDNAGNFPYDMETIRGVVEMKSLINAKAVPNALLREGMVSEGEDWEGRPVLNLTEAGRDMLDYYESNPDLWKVA